MKHRIPIFFYPTRKIILDDDVIFAESILYKMEGKDFSFYSSPDSLQDYLMNEYHPSFKQSDLFAEEIDSEVLSSNFHIPVKKLNCVVANKVANDISVVLVDYHMPGITGIDFVRKFKNYPFKKILITGEDDYAIGIDALNAGLIDAYIRKGDPDLLNKLNILVNVLEWKYFTEFSSSVYHVSNLEYLKHTHFLAKFEQLIYENTITSFYLVNGEGDFVGLNNEGMQVFIVVRSRKKLQELSILAEEDGASNEIVDKLMKAEVIPFFHDKQYWEIPATEWGTFLYPANQLEGDSSFVWAIISPYNY